MKITIGRKLVVGYLMLILFMAALALYAVRVSEESLRKCVGRNSILLASGMLKSIERNIRRSIDQLQLFAGGSLCLDCLSRSNAAFDETVGAEGSARQKDVGAWTAPRVEMAPGTEGDMNKALSNQMKRELLEFWERDRGYRFYTGVFVTNKYGAIVAGTGKVARQDRAHESWWQAARDKGLVMDQVQYDVDADAFVIPVSLRVNGANGEFTGIMRADLLFIPLIRDAELRILAYDTTEIKLISQKEKRLIYATGAFQMLEDISNKACFNGITGESGFFVVEEGSRKKLVSYVRSKQTESTPWTLVVEHDENELLRPISMLRNRIALASLVHIIVAFLLIALVSRSVSKPIKQLSKGAEIVGSGNLDYRVATESRDEIGELSRAFDGMIQNLKTVMASRDELNREIQQRIRAETDLEKALADLKRSNKELEQFAYVASHDLQEPLRKISGFSELLADRYKGRLDEKADKFIFYITDGATRMQGLIQDLLSYSRVISRAKPFEKTDTEEVLRQVISDMETSIRSSDAVITYDELPQVMADSSQLGRVFQNLIGNAMKFRKDQAPHIHISGRPSKDSQKEGQWVISVQDNGIGIESQYKERIFEIFQRLHSRDAYEGTGIGLAICKKIVERHGGRIWVESEPGKGSTFYFTLMGVGRPMEHSEKG